MRWLAGAEAMADPELGSANDVDSTQTSCEEIAHATDYYIGSAK